MMRRILVIDDDSGICAFICECLKSIGEYDVMVANTGKEGFRIAKSEEPDLILLDILLPDINGLDLLKKLSRNKKTCYIPVIMITGVSSKEAKEDACREFSDGYIVKPFDPNTLEAAVARTLKYHKGKQV
ncbi:two-component system response regulator [Verrucomicrobiota bacterium]